MSEPKQKCVQCGDEVPAGLILSHCPECDTTLPPPRPAAPAPTEPVRTTEGEREQARHLWGEHLYRFGEASPENIEAIARALARTRAEAMEEAAQVAKGHRITMSQGLSTQVISNNSACEAIAAAIRAKGGR